MSNELGGKINSEIPINEDTLARKSIFGNAIYQKQVSIVFRSDDGIGAKTTLRKSLDFIVLL